MSKIYDYLCLILLGIYIINTNYTGRLAFLIHPRYLWLTIGVGVLLSVFGLIGLYQNLYQNRKNLPKTNFKIFNSSLILLVLICSFFFIPVTILSSESFKTRSTSNNLNFTEEEKKQLQTKIDQGVDTTTYRFIDWVEAKYSNNNKVFENKKFKGEGFVTTTSQNNYLNLSRFVISCCAVDATPVTLVVKYDYQKDLKVDDWVELEGSFVIEEWEGKKQLIIIPTKVTKTKIPENAYITRN